MSVSDPDLELLEAYLDDALSPEEADALRRRLADEAQLAAAMAEVRNERAVRQSVWQTMEPSDVEIGRLVGRVNQSLRQREHWMKRWQVLRVGTAAAACLAFGFFGGWLMRTTSPTPTANPDQAVVSSGEIGNRLQQPGYHVALTDNVGNVIAIQTVDTHDKAREFVDDVDQMRSRQPRNTGRAVLISEEF